MRRLVLLACLAPALSGAAAEQHIDPQWFRQALLDEVSRWRTAAFTPTGFFQPSLDRQWRPEGRQVATLVSQSRLIFVMATGYELTGDRAYLEAARKGGEFLLAHFRDRKYGGWFYSVSPEGTVLDSSKDSYGHAFVIFGLSHAAQVTGDDRFRREALATWAEMKGRLRDRAGFIKPKTTRDFSESRGTNSQNPMMHLFEALLALHDLTGSPAVFDDAQSLAHGIFAKLFQDEGGYLPELYDSAWKPLSGARGGRIELGHQFEWAFLLSHAVERGVPAHYLQIGGRLLDYGMRNAYDSGDGGIFSRSDHNGMVSSRSKGWWEQCEFLRALMHYATLRGREDLWPPFDKSLRFVQRYFIDPEFGGWYSAYDSNTEAKTRRIYKGSPWMVGYHVTGMYLEALRLAQENE
jgi:mannobiose 2-epimerase